MEHSIETAKAAGHITASPASSAASTAGAAAGGVGQLIDGLITHFASDVPEKPQRKTRRGRSSKAGDGRRKRDDRSAGKDMH